VDIIQFSGNMGFNAFLGLAWHGAFYRILVCKIWALPKRNYSYNARISSKGCVWVISRGIALCPLTQHLQDSKNSLILTEKNVVFYTLFGWWFLHAVQVKTLYLPWKQKTRPTQKPLVSQWPASLGPPILPMPMARLSGLLLLVAHRVAGL